MCKRTKRTVRGGMRIATNNGHTWQRRTLLGSNYVHDSLTNIIHCKFSNTKAGAILIQRFNLKFRHRIRNTRRTICGGHIVIRHR